MEDKELKHLNRKELLEMLLTQVEENKKLKAQLNDVQTRLDNRKIAVDKAGSIAEAALQLNGVFEAAQNAAAQYLENIRQLSSKEETICRRMEEDAKKKADTIHAEADAYSRRVRSQADRYHKQVTNKIQDLLREQKGLQSLLYSLVEEQKDENEKNS